jgi:secondary thiamine-phosphate synthase enzyme
MLCFNKTVTYATDHNNLAEIEPKLVPYLKEFDFFSIHDLTEPTRQWVQESKIQNGLLTVQALHTTCVVALNELDEPCLLGDLNGFLRDLIPHHKPYLHNSKIRTKNLCADDKKCDRNADAHMKSFLFGAASQTLIVKAGQPVYGRWQKLCLIDFDGPRERSVAVQIIGE